MRHFLIHKYDFAQGDIESEWTSLCDLLRETGQLYPPPFYLQLEREFLDVVVQFLRKYDLLTLQYRFCYLIDDDLIHTEPSGWLQSLILPLEHTVGLVEEKGFQALSYLERLAVFQLAIRGAVNVAIEDDSTGVTLSTVDDGFYWYITLRDCDRPEELVTSPRLFIDESINIFD